MNTVDYFFNSAQTNPVSDRQSKIEELKKPVYSKRLKQKRHKKLFGSTQFIAFSDFKTTLKFMQKSTTNHQQNIKKSKSDLFLSRKKQNFENQETKPINLGSNLIIQKLQYDKQTGKLQVKKNNFMKTLTQIAFSANNTLVKKKTQNKTQQRCSANTHENFFKRSFYEDQMSLEQKRQNMVRDKHKDLKQNFKVIEIIKKQEIQQNVINDMSILRKKRHSLGQENKTLDSNKKQSLIRKNSLFLMNYLKQKEKQSEIDKSPHINFMRNTAQNIKIQENTDLRKNLINRINEKTLFKNKVQEQRIDKMNKLFNTMKIDPW